jgi:RNA polymerase sigma-70 factor (ECF subfamily)
LSTAPDPASLPESRVLIARARAGSSEALGRLLEQYRQHLLALASRGLDARAQARESPSDVVQQTFLEAQRDFRQFGGDEPGQLRRWLERILRTTLEDLRNRHGRQRRRVDRERPIPDSNQPGYQALTADLPSPPDGAAAREEAERLARALNKLPEHHRRVIELRSLQQRPFAEVAEILQVSEDAARMRWFRAIDALRQEMKREHEPD